MQFYPHQLALLHINVNELNKFAHEIGEKLRNNGIRVLVDDTDARAPDKMWKWIKRGAPLRVEIGAKEMADNTLTVTRRDLGKSSKTTVAVEHFLNDAKNMLDIIQHDMLIAVEKRNKTMIHDVKDLKELESALESGKIGFFRIKYDLTTNDEFDGLIEKYKISRRCLDDKDPNFVFVAKSY